MKILMVSPYVTIEGRPEFERNKTGFGYMVYDIARAIAKTEDVDLLATDSRGNAFVEGSVHFLKRFFVSFLRYVFNCLPSSKVSGLMKQYPDMQNGTRQKLLYYWLMTGYLKSIIKKGNYDVVHIHGCSFSTDLWIQVCKHCGQKFVVTLHGLNSFSETVKLESAGKKYERDFLKRVVEGEIPITVISTGMKRLIQETYGVDDCKNIIVVCNSFNFNDVAGGGKFDVKKHYGLPDNSRVILYVGNICRRKNQGQMIKVFDYLPSQLAENTYFLFLGANLEKDYQVSDFAARTSYPDHFIACGVVDKAFVPQYYEQGDAVVLMSLSEGFGLSLIEGMHFGLPAMSFNDVDAYDDIYDDCAMVGVEGHADDAVAKGLEKLLTRDWDKQKIKDYSKKFEPDNMAKQYVEVYQGAI